MSNPIELGENDEITSNNMVVYSNNNQPFELEIDGTLDRITQTERYPELAKQQDEAQQVTESGVELTIQSIQKVGQSEILVDSKLKQHKDNQQPDEQEDSLNLQQHLEQQILRYRKIQSVSDQPKDKQVLQKLIHTMEQQLEKLRMQIDNEINDVSNFGGISLIKEMETNQNQKYQNAKKRLLEIYKFYCKIAYSRGPSDDFGRIQRESSIMSQGKFIIFCRQFELLDPMVHHQSGNSILQKNQSTVMLNDSAYTHKWWLQNKYLQLQKPHQHPTNKTLLSSKQLNHLFKQISQNKSEISYDQFYELLKKLAVLMFNEAGEAEQHLFEYLQIDSLNYRKKMKALTIPFNSKEAQGFRKPEGLEQLYQLSSEQTARKKEIIQKWRDEKQQEIHDRLMYPTSESINRSRSTLQDPQYVKSTNYKERKHKYLDLQLKQQGVLDWEKLDRMNPDILNNEGFRPTDLIEEEEDDDDRYYLKSYEIQPLTKVEQSRMMTDISKKLKMQSEKQPRKRLTEQRVQLKSSVSAYLRLPKLQQ